MEVCFCHNCGTKLKENTKFCGACGTAVLTLADIAPEETPLPVETVAEEPAVQVTEPETQVDIVEPEAEPVIAAAETEPEPAEEVSEAIAEPEIPPVVIAFEPEVEEPAADPSVSTEPQMPAEPVEACVQVETKPAETKKKKKDPYPRRGVGRTILAVLLCVLIFLWSLGALAIYDVRHFTEGKQFQTNLNGVLENLDLTITPASTVVAGSVDPEQSLAEWAAEKVAEAYDGTVEITEEEMVHFLEESTVLPFFTEKLTAAVNDIHKGTASSDITRKELEDLMWENTELIEQTTGQPLTETEVAKLADQVEYLGATKFLSAENMRKTASPVYYGMKILLSYWVIGFFGGMALLFVLLLAQNNKWKMLRTCGDVGITWTVLSCIMILTALFTKLLPDVWNGIFQIEAIGSLSSAVLYSGLIPALILLGVSVLLILIKVIGKLIVTKPAKTQV